MGLAWWQHGQRNGFLLHGGGVTAWAAARWVFLTSHSLSFSLYYSLLSKFVLPLAFSSFFFNLFFRLFWTTGLVVFFFFFNIYMGFGLADSVGWFRIFGGGPKLKRKGRPKSSYSFFFFFFFFWENLLTIYIYIFFWCPDRARAP